MTQLVMKEYESNNLSQEAHELKQYASICEVNDWQDILEIYHHLKQTIAPKKVLLILEDIGQCHYTSMHASMSDELYVDVSQYVGDADSEKEELILDNIQPQMMHHYIQQLAKTENKLELQDLNNKFNLSKNDFDVLRHINTQPAVILDNEI